jgi:hypothetical protein
MPKTVEPRAPARPDKEPPDVRRFKGDPLEANLPQPGLVCRDDEGELPLIHQSELVDLDDARLHFEIAKADYDKLRSHVIWKLTHHCRVAPGEISVWLDEDGEFHMRQNRRQDMREREE